MGLVQNWITISPEQLNNQVTKKVKPLLTRGDIMVTAVFAFCVTVIARVDLYCPFVLVRIKLTTHTKIRPLLTQILWRESDANRFFCQIQSLHQSETHLSVSSVCPSAGDLNAMADFNKRLSREELTLPHIPFSIPLQ